MGNTKIFDSEELETKLIEDTIKEVVNILDERGYNAINQIVGYLLSGDPGYISSYKEARNKLTSIDRNKILETMIKQYIKQ